MKTRIVLLLIIAVALYTLVACASERYLTAEQDARMREICEVHGCEVIPTPVWQQIEAILKRLGAI